MAHQGILVAALPLLWWAGASPAQDLAKAAELRQEVEAARAEASSAARTLHDELIALIPPLPGWSCHDREQGGGGSADALHAIPLIALTCEHLDQLLDVTFMLEPTSAAVLCRSVASTQRGIADEAIKSDLIRLFENPTWRLQRQGTSLKGCAAGAVAVDVQGNSRDTGKAGDPTAVDALGEGLLKSDPGALLAAARASGQPAALARLMQGLDAQSHLLADMIPSPPGVIRELILPSMTELPEELRLPLPMILVNSPAASASLTLGDCRVHVELSASSTSLHDATVAERWGLPGGKDGSGNHAYRRRISDRFSGQERKDGTGIEALVDRAVVVRVTIPGAEPCQTEPGIVSRLFGEILTHDLSAFGSR
jgi:hypothetical protein